MHIQSGHLPAEVYVAGFVSASALTAATLPSLKRASPPRVAMATAAFFVSSSLAIPALGTSFHLSLLGVSGVVLGGAAFPSVLVGVFLQFALLAHGGLDTLGVNATTMGVGALVAGGLWRAGPVRWAPGRAALAAGVGTLCALLLYGAALWAAGEALRAVAYVCLVLHLPLILVEAAVAAQVVVFLQRVRPDVVGLEAAG